MAKPKLSPREKVVLNNFEDNQAELITELQDLSDNVLDLIDIVYLDVVIGQEKEDIKKRITDVEDAIGTSIKEIKQYKRKNAEPKRKLIIR